MCGIFAYLNSNCERTRRQVAEILVNGLVCLTFHDIRTPFNPTSRNVSNTVDTILLEFQSKETKEL
jgi:hypothetical protein